MTAGTMVSYVRSTSHRKLKFQLGTTISGSNNDLLVRKFAISSSATPFLQSLESKYDHLLNSGVSFRPLRPLQCDPDGILFEYVHQRSFDALMSSALRQRNKNELLCLFDDYLQIIRSCDSQLSATSPEFSLIFGDSPNKGFACLRSGCVDLRFDNIFPSQTPIVIDYEWTFPFSVPSEYVVFRSLLGFYANYSCYRPNSVLPLEELLARANITEADQQLFSTWEFSFQQYVSARELPRTADNIDRFWQYVKGLGSSEVALLNIQPRSSSLAKLSSRLFGAGRCNG